MDGAPDANAEAAAGYRAIERLYHSFLTGLILATVVRRGETDAESLVFRVFRRQHLERFLPGLRILGLDRLPHAVACAQYHYLGNKLGGVKVEYIRENDRKAWVRYPPPRWIWEGTAVCGIPSAVSAAMLRAWHAHNGVSLGNPRLGFVCTKQTVDGQPGLEGYYYEANRDLSPDERLIFAPDEEAPPCDPALQPNLKSDDWPEARLLKVLRNYAMEYIRNILPEVLDLMGEESGGELAGATARLIGMQYYDETAATLGIEGDSPGAFAEYLARMADAQEDGAEMRREGAGWLVRTKGWRLMRDIEPLPDALFRAWNELWVGALSVHNRLLRLEVLRAPTSADGSTEWRIAPR